jgi:hypothetical protein
VSYYENRINALEARIEEMAMLNRMKAVSVEASLMIRIKELNDENARLKADIQRLTMAGNAMASQLYAFGYDTAWDFWNAAKEGKPSV